MPQCGPFPGGVCVQCGLRDEPCIEARQIDSLFIAQLGGMPIAQDELSYAEWRALGVLHARRKIL